MERGGHRMMYFTGANFQQMGYLSNCAAITYNKPGVFGAPEQLICLGECTLCWNWGERGNVHLTKDHEDKE